MSDSIETVSSSEPQPADKNAGKPSARKKARRFVVQGLYSWELSKNNIARVEQYLRRENDMRKTDVQYLHELLHGIVAETDTLDASLMPCLDRKLSELDPIERSILRLGVYELKHRIEVPYRVVINEGVELAKEYGATDGHKYVNGVLDRLARSLRPAEQRSR